MKDITGLVSGILTVIGFSHKIKKKGKNQHGFTYFWDCKCGCGKKLKVDRNNLFREFGSKSCGCARAQGIWKGVGDISSSYFSLIRCNAKKRDIPFQITLQEIWELFLVQNRKCALTGVDLIFARKYGRGDEQTASLDRIDASKPYIKGNLMWVHKEINGMRLTISLDKFRHWCYLVSQHESFI